MGDHEAERLISHNAIMIMMKEMNLPARFPSNAASSEEATALISKCAEEFVEKICRRAEASLMRANAAGDKSKGKAKKRPVSKSSGVMKRVTTSAIIEAMAELGIDQKYADAIMKASSEHSGARASRKRKKRKTKAEREREDEVLAL